MKPGSALFLQAIVVLVGLGALFLLLWEPHLEGRNAHATTFEIYFRDPFLAYVYVGSIPLFVALHRAFRLLGHAGQTGAFSQVTVDGLRTIKHCALVIVGFVIGGIGFVIAAGDPDDRPAGLFMCLLVIGAASAVAVTATVLARKLQTTFGRPEDV